MLSDDLDFFSDRDTGDENDSWPPHERVLTEPDIKARPVYFGSAAAFREALGPYEEPSCG